MHGLRRTVGVPGLFATAYGNVGSSIYYALGLVASLALGSWVPRFRVHERPAQPLPWMWAVPIAVNAAWAFAAAVFLKHWRRHGWKCTVPPGRSQRMR